MLSDIEIAQQATLLPIKEVASQIGISEDELEFYGKYKAKLSDELSARVSQNPDGKLILVTARSRIRYQGRSRRRRLRAGSADGGHQPALYGRYARNHGGE